ncbi:small, acid-soluble spore protein L [Lentibacillus saliphilus]|nr:small, acid-soluble spore protein L [Lentibacillus saliphilus]
MSDKQDIWQKKRAQTSVNPQGLSEDEKDHQPKSQLEQRAKKKNTKL